MENEQWKFISIRESEAFQEPGYVHDFSTP